MLAAIVPFFHVAGLHGVLNLGIFAGATIVTMQRFDLGAFLAAAEDHSITSVLVIPPILNALTTSPTVSDFDLSSVRSIDCVAAPLGAEAKQAASDRLGCVVRQGYGQTEACGPITWKPSEPGRLRHGSVGLPVSSTECKIVDLASGRELGPGQAGEVLVRGPQVMKGYLNHPEATASTVEPDGWLHTGDVGQLDDLLGFVAERVAPYKKVRALAVVATIPKSPSGKILRRVLVERERAAVGASR